jgi:hypothetical protein
MDTSKALGGIQSRLFKRIAIVALAFAVSVGIMFGLYAYAPEKHLQRISNAVGIPSKTRPIRHCGGFVGSDAIWAEAQTKYQHLVDDKFTYEVPERANFVMFLPNPASLASPCKRIEDPRSSTTLSMRCCRKKFPR